MTGSRAHAFFDFSSNYAPDEVHTSSISDGSSLKNDRRNNPKINAISNNDKINSDEIRTKDRPKKPTSFRTLIAQARKVDPEDLKLVKMESERFQSERESKLNRMERRLGINSADSEDDDQDLDRDRRRKAGNGKRSLAASEAKKNSFLPKDLIKLNTQKRDNRAVFEIEDDLRRDRLKAQASRGSNSTSSSLKGSDGSRCAVTSSKDQVKDKERLRVAGRSSSREVSPAQQRQTFIIKPKRPGEATYLESPRPVIKKKIEKVDSVAIDIPRSAARNKDRLEERIRGRERADVRTRDRAADRTRDKDKLNEKPRGKDRATERPRDRDGLDEKSGEKVRLDEIYRDRKGVDDRTRDRDRVAERTRDRSRVVEIPRDRDRKVEKPRDRDRMDERTKDKDRYSAKSNERPIIKTPSGRPQEVDRKDKRETPLKKIKERERVRERNQNSSDDENSSEDERRARNKAKSFHINPYLNPEDLNISLGKRKYKYRSGHSDSEEDADMEVGYNQIRREEARSKRIAVKEDEREERMEREREVALTKKRRRE